jgi:hypothetical protein
MKFRHLAADAMTPHPYSVANSEKFSSGRR